MYNGIQTTGRTRIEARRDGQADVIRKVCVFGTGAIGGVLAARLARAGAEVSVIARGAVLDAIHGRGITVHTEDGGSLHCAPTRASDDPRDIGEQDAVIVAVKATALPSVAASIAPLLGRRSVAAFVTNGLPWWYGTVEADSRTDATVPVFDPGRVIERAVHGACLVGGVVYSACTVVEPGVIRSEDTGAGLVLGQPNGRLGRRTRALATLFDMGGMRCDVTPNIRDEVWRKLMTNLASGPVCLLTRRGMRESLADPVVRAAAVEAVREGMTIARAILGHPLEGRAEEWLTRLASINHKPSVLQDLELGRPLEFEVLFDRPLQLARLAGVATPMLDLLIGLAARAADIDPPLSTGAASAVTPGPRQPRRSARDRPGYPFAGARELVRP